MLTRSVCSVGLCAASGYEHGDFVAAEQDPCSETLSVGRGYYVDISPNSDGSTRSGLKPGWKGARVTASCRVKPASTRSTKKTESGWGMICACAAVAATFLFRCYRKYSEAEEDKQKKAEKQEILQAYQVYDTDGDGFISVADLRKIFRSGDEPFTDEEVEEVIRRTKHEGLIDSDGQITIERPFF